MPKIESVRLATYLYKFKADSLQAAAVGGLDCSLSAFIDILLHWGVRGLLREIRLRPGTLPPASMEKLLELEEAFAVLPHFGPFEPTSEVDRARRMIDDLEV